jgi:protein-S-isoprenylcysteine O-methyltransferase Ste14
LQFETLMSTTGKAPWIVRIPTPVWLLGLIVAALLVDLAFELPAVAAHRPAGAVLIAAGVALSVWAALTFRRQRAEIVPSSETHRALVATGPFRFSRNPMYLGSLFVGVGAALLAGTWPMWLVPATLFLLQNFVIIPFEERSMGRTFGDAYRDYRSRVRRWL